jgi:hypothetical protein
VLSRAHLRCRRRALHRSPPDQLASVVQVAYRAEQFTDRYGRQPDMNDRRLLALLGTVLLCGFSACSSTPPPAPAPTQVAAVAPIAPVCSAFPHGGVEEITSNDTVPEADSIEIVSVSPDSNTPVSASTMLVVELLYNVKNLANGPYIIIAQFDTIHRRVTTDGDFRNYSALKHASGLVRLCFPVAMIWDYPNIRWPLVAHFYLNRAYAGGGEVIAHSDTVKFISATVPPAARNQPPVNDAEVPEDYQAALTTMYFAFIDYGTRAVVCAEHFQDLSMAIHAAYKDWQDHYGAMQTSITMQYRDMQSRLNGNTGPTVEGMTQLQREKVRQRLGAQAPEKLRPRCESDVSFLNSPESNPEVHFAKLLATIRSYNPAPSKP